ncbi:MAG: VCBS repeat-containing protein [Planctomycetota bacterium]
MSALPTRLCATAVAAGLTIAAANAQVGFTLSPESPVRSLPVNWLPQDDNDSSGCPDLPGITRFGQFSRDGGAWANVDTDPELEFIHLGNLQSAVDPNCADGRPVPTPQSVLFPGDPNALPYLLFYPNFGTTIFVFEADGSPVTGWPRILGANNFTTVAVGDINGDGDDEIVAMDFSFGAAANLAVLEGDGTQPAYFNGGNAIVVGGVFKSASLANLDADPGLEIILIEEFGGGADLTVYDNDGSFFGNFPVSIDTNRQSIPSATDFFQIPAGLGSSGATVSVGDIDGDGQPEIVAQSFTDLVAYEADGTQITTLFTPAFPGESQTATGTPASTGARGWEPPAFVGSPLNSNNAPMFSSFNAATLVNLDSDPALEIVFSVNLNIQTGGGSPFPDPQIYAINADGSVLPGYPLTHPTPFISSSGATNTNGGVLSIADIDSDGNYDIVFNDGCFGDGSLALPGIQDCSTLMAWDAITAQPKPGFPVSVSANEGVPGNFDQIMIADIDFDGLMELFVGNNKAANANLVWNHDGTPVEGWDLVANPDFDGPGVPNFADADGDGFMEIALAISNITNTTSFNDDPPVEDNPDGDRGSLFMYSSDVVPYSDERAPVRTYGYNNHRTFVVPPLPECAVCIADFNGDGPVNDADVTDFGAAVDLKAYCTDLNDDFNRDAFDNAVHQNSLLFGCD